MASDRFTVRCVRRFLSLGALLVLAAPAMGSQPGRVAAARVRQESYRHFLDDMLYTHLGDNRGFGPEHDLAQANIVSLFSSFGLTVTLEPVAFGGNTYYDVVATKVGITYPSQEYIIGAHYDSVNNPGGDDNASGVSLVLEAARVLSAYDSDYTIRFIAFDREEQGLIGSQAYVAAHWNDDIRGMISADMVAYNTGTDHAEIYGREASDPLKLALTQAVTTYGDGLTATLFGAFDASDHAPFEWFGFSACLFIEEWGNPNYHTQEDSVDTPDYIDYAYATRMTRSIVGFLVDHAGLAVDIPDADYDGDGDVDLDDYNTFAACFAGPGIPPDPPGCGFFDLDADGDVDCADWDLFAAVWNGPGDPPVFWPCKLLPPETLSDSARCVTVTPPEHGMPVALLLTGDPDDPSVACFSRYVQTDGTLGPTPVFQPYDTWGPVLVCDAQIIPDTLYRVWCDYGTPGSPMLSPSRKAVTSLWGDTVGPFTGTAWAPPDGSVDVIDVVAILDRFRDLPTAPPLYRVDLIGMGASGIECQPDQHVDITDAVAALDAFRGTSFWASTGCSPPCAGPSMLP